MPNRRLLVVENDRTTAAIIQMYVHKCDYQVVDVVSTGDHAIRSASKHDPDLVLMDIKLDGEIDGITAAETIINQLHVPVVYVTAYSDAGLLQRAQRTRHSGFINKPLREVDLRTTLRLAVEKDSSGEKAGKSRRVLNAEELKQQYKLTRSESNLVLKLIRNQDLNAISEESGITMNTLRTHLKHIYRKTGSRSQASLLMKLVHEFDLD